MMALAEFAATGNICPWLRTAQQAAMQAGSGLILGLALVLGVGNAWSAVPVSGSIATDTTWAYAHSPYIVTGDLSIDADATLTIEPGVAVYMSAGTNLTVRSGALRVLGNASGWVTITSYRDFPNANPAPASGDWGPLRFLAGTRSTDTRLTYTRVRYGEGLVLEGASPTFEQVEITAHSAPAISIDLASSPTGSGVVATGNALNGIAVPAGIIAGNASWSLTGLPYVVSAGRVRIGGVAVEIDPPSLSLDPAQVGAFSVAVANAAPPGGHAASISVSDGAVAQAPASLLIPEGAKSATMAVTALTEGETSLTASIAGLGSASARIEVRPPTIITLAPPEAQIAVGRRQEFLATLWAPAPPGGRVLNLLSSDPAVLGVPGQITVPVGEREARFQAHALSAGTATLTASHAGHRDGSAAVQVFQAQLELAPASALALVGVAQEYQLRVSVPAPAEGLVVNLSSSNPSVATVPSHVTLAPASSQARFVATPLAGGTTTLTATASGHDASQSTLAVSAAVLTMPETWALAPGASRELTVNLSDPAPAGGLTVSFRLDNPQGPIRVALPESITLPAGALAATVLVTGISAGPGTTITASAPYYASASTSVHVVDYRFALSGASPPLRIPLGVTWSTPLTTQGLYSVVAPLTIDAGADHSNILGTAPAQLTIAAGTTGSVQALRVSGLQEGATTLRLRSAGFHDTEIATTVVERGGISFLPGAMVVGQGLRAQAELHLQSGAAWYESPFPETIELQSSDPSRVAVPPSVSTCCNPSRADFAVTGVAPTGTSVTIDTYSPAGYAPPEAKLTVSVVTPELVFEQLVGQTYVGAARNAFRVCWQVPGAAKPRQVSASDTVLEIALSDVTGAAVSAIYDAAMGGTAVDRTTIPQGWSCSPDLYVDTPVNPGAYTITARVPGLVTSVSPSQSVKRLTLRFTQTQAIVGRGLMTGETEFAVERLLDGAPFADTSPLTVTLQSADTSRVQVPPSVTIPSRGTRANFELSGIENTSTPIAVRIGNTFPPLEQTLLASVVAPTLGYSGLAGTRHILSAPDDFYVYWDVPEAAGINARHQRARTAQTLALSLAAVNPPEMNFGFTYTNWPGDQVITSAIGYGANRSPGFNAGRPNQVGSYRIAAQAGAEPVALSEVQTVQPLELRFGTVDVLLYEGLSAHRTLVRMHEGTALTADAPTSVEIVNSDPSKISVPATVIIPAWESSVQVPLQALAATTQPLTLSFRAHGFKEEGNVMRLTVEPLRLKFIELEPQRTVGDAIDEFSLCLDAPWSGISQWLETALEVDVSIAEAAPPGIVPGILDAGGQPVATLTIPAGESCVTAAVASPTALGSYRLFASAASVTPVASETQNVIAPVLAFSQDRMVLGKGLRQPDYGGVQLTRFAGGSPYAGRPLIVTLSVSDASRVSVPATVTFGEWQSQVALPLEGLASDTDPVLVRASAPGYESAPYDLEVTVVDPELRFVDLDQGRAVGAPRDEFRLRWWVPGGNNEWEQIPRAETTLGLDLTGVDPAGIVAGLYADETSSVPLTTLTWPAGEGFSPSVYVASPTAAGRYQVRASVAGQGEFSSAVQNVGSPQLHFADRDHEGQAVAHTVVGEGLISTTVTLQWAIAPGRYAEPAPVDITVNLSCADPGVCSVPASVTLPAGDWSVSVPITGLSAGNTTIRGVAPGYAVAADFPVTVSAPRLVFYEEAWSFWPDDSGGYQAYFNLGFTATGAVNNQAQTSVAARSIELAASAGVVEPTALLPAGEAWVGLLLSQVPLWARGAVTATSACCGSAVSPPFLVVPNNGGGERY